MKGWAADRLCLGSSRHPGGDVKWVIRFEGLEFRAEAFGGHQMQFHESADGESLGRGLGTWPWSPLMSRCFRDKKEPAKETEQEWPGKQEESKEWCPGGGGHVLKPSAARVSR